MKQNLGYFAGAAAAFVLIGCATVPPNAERGPHNTMAYDVAIDATPPGAQIEANGQVVGTTPLHLKIFGDPDGTFHDFGSEYYIIRALPLTTNQYVQSRYFGTGNMMGPEDHIPKEIYFDMSQPPAAYPAYGYRPYAPPPAYYYGPDYYGPSFRFYFGPSGRWHRRW